MRRCMRYCPSGFHRSMPCLASEIVSPIIQSPRPLSWRDDRLRKFQRVSSDNQVMRVGTFNILADEYTRTAVARDEMFPYCPEEALSSAFRGPRIAAEVLELDCDLFGLQEW